MVDQDEASMKDDGELERRPSWPYPTILFLYLVILIITPVAGSTIGLLLFCGLLGFCLWGALSRKQYEQLKKRYPSLSRNEYVLNNLLFPVVLPLFISIVFMAYKHFS